MNAIYIVGVKRFIVCIVYLIKVPLWCQSEHAVSVCSCKYVFACIAKCQYYFTYKSVSPMTGCSVEYADAAISGEIQTVVHFQHVIYTIVYQRLVNTSFVLK